MEIVNNSLENYNSLKIKVSKEEIASFGQCWKVTEFALFGSILRDDFRPDIDVDVLVSFAPDAKWSLFDIVHMKEELEALFRREVDFVEKAALKGKIMKFLITIFQDEDRMFIVECPSIPGCVSQGKTEQEALTNIKEAIKDCLEVRAEKGMPLTITTREVEVPV